MEFLRFGSSIPGTYWGCCAMDVIQNFNFDPDQKTSIQLVDGDGGMPITNSKGALFAGPTYLDVFKQRLRIGTFSKSDMPNHGFLAVLTSSQISSGIGKKWLKILKEHGFEFIRTVDNSVYSGSSTIKEPGQGNTSAHPNYLFGLFRNIGQGAIADPYTPPKEWTDLSPVVPEAWETIVDGVQRNLDVQKAQLPLYEALGKPTFLSEAEVLAAGAPVILAGQRSKNPQEPKIVRDAKKPKSKATNAKAKVADPFSSLSPAAPDFDDSVTLALEEMG